MISRPRSVATSTTNTSGSSVSARSNPRTAFGPGLHARAEAGRRRLAAVHRDDEGRLRAGPGNAGRHRGPCRKTRSWISMACRSHERAPRNAYLGTGSGLGCTANEFAVCSIVNNVNREGNRYFFHECGPTA